MVPGPLILRLVEGPSGRFLEENGKVALIWRYAPEPGTRVRVWVEESAKWVEGVVRGQWKVNYQVLEELVSISGYGSVDEWVSSVERMNKGSLPGWVFVVERVERLD